MRLIRPRLLPRATTVGLVLIALLVFFNALISEWNVDRIAENGSRVTEAQSVLTTLETVLSSVTQAETAERGFLITDNSDYLTTYQEEIDRTGKTLDSLSQLTRKDPHNHERIAALRQRVEARFDELR